MTEREMKREKTGIELLLNEPEIVAWLEPPAHDDDDDEAAEGGLVHTRVLEPRHGPTLLVRPLRHGDVRTVMGVFERLGDQSRRTRFNGPKPCLSFSELRQLAAVDATRHALIAYVEGDPLPVAIARLVRDGRSAEIAFAVADDYQHRGIGSALAAELIGGCARGRHHGDHGARLERQPGRRRAAPPHRRHARHPARRPRADDSRRDRLAAVLERSSLSAVALAPAWIKVRTGLGSKAH